MDIRCKICDSSTRFFLNQGGYDFNKCPNCGLFFVNPMPTNEDLTRVYSPQANYQSNKTKKDYRNQTNNKYIEIFKRLKKFKKVGKVLDVGASDGEFLYHAKNEGLQVFGVEPNKTTADIANKNGLNVFNGFLENCNFPENSFDVLRLGDVLEHSNSPRDLISLCRSFLKNDGLLLISIPNMDSNWTRSTYILKSWFGLPWSVLEPPYHLLYFSKSNLDLFFKNNGFILLESWYNRPPTLKYELGNTHLLGRYKKDRSFTNLVLFFSGFIVYTIVYFFDFLITPFKQKDYSMVCIYKNNA